MVVTDEGLKRIVQTVDPESIRGETAKLNSVINTLQVCRKDPVYDK